MRQVGLDALHRIDVLGEVVGGKLAIVYKAIFGDFAGDE